MNRKIFLAFLLIVINFIPFEKAYPATSQPISRSFENLSLGMNVADFKNKHYPAYLNIPSKSGVGEVYVTHSHLPLRYGKTSEEFALPATYLEVLRNKITKRINYPKEAVEGFILTRVTISSNGRLKNIDIIDEHSTKNETLKEIAIKAIKDASPFPAFPEIVDSAEISFPLGFRFSSGGRSEKVTLLFVFHNLLDNIYEVRCFFYNGKLYEIQIEYLMGYCPSWDDFIYNTKQKYGEGEEGIITERILWSDRTTTLIISKEIRRQSEDVGSAYVVIYIDNELKNQVDKKEKEEGPKF